MKAKSYTVLIVESRLNMVRQPFDEDAYNYPGGIASECQRWAETISKPVVLVGKNGDTFEFNPSKSN
jgi:hypothetical protein